MGPDRLLEIDPDAKIPTDVLPMYGGHSRDGDFLTRAADQWLEKGTTEAFGSREKASEAFARQGLAYYDRNEYADAMRRFNQAWLLDQQNPIVFYGFAAVYQDHGNALEAGPFARTALELGISDPVWLADCGFVLAQAEAAQFGERRAEAAEGEIIPSPEELARFQSELRAIGERALAASNTASSTTRTFVLNTLFRTQMVAADYHEAWRTADSLEALGEAPTGKMMEVLRRHPRASE